MSINEKMVEKIAQRFKVLGETSRLKLIMCLKRGEKNVTQLVEQTGLNQANVSRHLKSLCQERIVGRRKKGLNVIYFINDQDIFLICETVCSSLKKS